MIGTWISGLMPMNLYISQAVGNEPLAGALSAVVLLACLTLLIQGFGRSLIMRAIWIGVCLGLALLTKASAVLLIPLVIAACIFHAPCGAANWKHSAQSIVASMTAAAAIAGWWYVRNTRLYGVPLITGTEQALIGRVWWQDPSYRTPLDYLRFHAALSKPVYSAVHGVWDALYSTFALDGDASGLDSLPPWNVELMLACTWLALPLVLAIAAGTFMPLRRSRDSGTTGFRTARRTQIFSSAALLIHLFALLRFSLICPAYSAVKATYALGLMPCLTLLACMGLDPLMHRPWLRSAVSAWLAVLGVSAYCAYFVV
jgi:hypothetical protein